MFFLLKISCNQFAANVKLPNNSVRLYGKTKARVSRMRQYIFDGKAAGIRPD
jgi:hypothetical protein